MTSPNTTIADMQLVETNMRQQIAHLNDEIAGLKSDVAYVKKQRDELLKAVELIYLWADNWDSEFMNDQEWINNDYPEIQRIVANAKGESC